MSIINNHTLQPLIPPHPPPQAHYYAKTYNWRFADWQSADFASLHQDPAQLNALKLAMEQEAGVTDADCARFMAGYYKRMNPTQPANACGCCGTMDVPIPDDEKLAENLGILSFTEIPLPRLALRQHHHCGAERGGYPCSAQCPWLLAPLTYSNAENAAYDAPWPAHITPPLQLRGLSLLSGPGQASAQRHSAFFVPFLRAAQGLQHANIPFVRSFVGTANWDAAVARTHAVFQAAGVTPALTGWNAAGYAGEETQLALLDVEQHLMCRAEWPLRAGVLLVPGTIPLTGGQLLMELVALRIAEARAVLQPQPNPPLAPEAEATRASAAAALRGG